MPCRVPLGVTMDKFTSLMANPVKLLEMLESPHFCDVEAFDDPYKAGACIAEWLNSREWLTLFLPVDAVDVFPCMMTIVSSCRAAGVSAGDCHIAGFTMSVDGAEPIRVSMVFVPALRKLKRSLSEQIGIPIASHKDILSFEHKYATACMHGLDLITREFRSNTVEN